MSVVPGIAVAPEQEADWMREAVQSAGATVAPLAQADALIWYGKPSELKPVLARAPRLRWIQLPAAGIEHYLPLIGDDGRTWTAAKGVYADHCAEHALGLAVAGFRHLDAGARSQTWRKRPGKTLFGARVVTVGGGGIARSLLRLLQPFHIDATVIRRRPEPVPGADRTLHPGDLMQALPDADLIVLAAPLTAETERMIAERQLRAMKDSAWLINVARGRLINTGHLVQALTEHWIGGAGLDVTDPEPLPDEHPLWELDNCIITSHTANPPNLERESFRVRIADNVHRFLTDQALLGVVDRVAGY